ncbi:uncharacterized protein A4U43_C10F1910 [Asparagus officinalis]|uniref:Uncharacterized protein n=1 Tax=Asparagus officinalis TaxID=4686 RepID=A0A5P1DZX0_ASPOF|nr:uncharacterized protein A4U43_C10F1910 [Asparagus officinalis]
MKELAEKPLRAELPARTPRSPASDQLRSPPVEQNRWSRHARARILHLMRQGRAASSSPPASSPSGQDPYRAEKTPLACLSPRIAACSCAGLRTRRRERSVKARRLGHYFLPGTTASRLPRASKSDENPAKLRADLRRRRSAGGS